MFGEAHGEFQDFWQTVTGGANKRIDLSFGGGYRAILGGRTFVGGQRILRHYPSRRDMVFFG